MAIDDRPVSLSGWTARRSHRGAGRRVSEQSDRRPAPHVPVRAALLRRQLRSRREAARRPEPGRPAGRDGHAAVSERAPRRTHAAGDVREQHAAARVGGATGVGGTLNGKPFTSIDDGDPRIGPRLEMFAAGQYTWLPFAHIESVRMQPPKRLRDLLWAPAIVRTGAVVQGTRAGRGADSRSSLPEAGRTRTTRSASAARPSGSPSRTGARRRSARRCCSSTTRKCRCSSCASSRSRRRPVGRREPACRCVMSC